MEAGTLHPGWIERRQGFSGPPVRTSGNDARPSLKLLGSREHGMGFCHDLRRWPTFPCRANRGLRVEAPQQTSQKASFVRGVHHSPFCMSTLIVYETATAYGIAKALLREWRVEDASQNFGIAAWKMELLGIPGLCEAAADDAAQSRWVIVAFENVENVPFELECWLKAWHQENSQHSQTLVACHAQGGNFALSQVQGKLPQALLDFACAHGHTFLNVVDESNVNCAAEFTAGQTGIADQTSPPG